MYGSFTDRLAYLENLFVAVGNAEASNKMASYSTDQKVLPESFYTSGGSRVAAEGQYRREFSVKRVSFLIFGLLITYSYTDTIETETSAANLTANEQHCHVIEIWCELRCRMKDSIALIYSFMMASLYLLVIHLHRSSFVCLSVFSDV